MVIGPDAARPCAPSALVTNEENEVARCAQSSYCLTPNLQLLWDAWFSRVAVVGVACGIQAIQKIKNLIPHLLSRTKSSRPLK
jgi:coenzyme F420 hydrogenase subunit beta